MSPLRGAFAGRSRQLRLRGAICLALGLGAAGCGGGMPLLHPAAALREGEVTMGGGFGAQVPIPQQASDAAVPAAVLHRAAVAPGLSPWASGRVGIDDDGSEAGISYFGRSLRADYRYVLPFDRLALSFGVGASVLMPKREDEHGARVAGGGGDVPILFGWCNPTEIYCAWLGARGGFEVLDGDRELPLSPDALDLPTTEAIQGWHAYGGGLLGLRIGFRYVYAAIELHLTGHYAKGSVGDVSIEDSLFALSPAGGLIGRF